VMWKEKQRQKGKERKKRKATRKRECIKGKSKSFSSSQDQLQSSLKLLESSTLKFEVFQQQGGLLPWVPSSICLQACPSARLAGQSGEESYLDTRFSNAGSRTAEEDKWASLVAADEICVCSHPLNSHFYLYHFHIFSLQLK